MRAWVNELRKRVSIKVNGVVDYDMVGKGKIKYLG